MLREMLQLVLKIKENIMAMKEKKKEDKRKMEKKEDHKMDKKKSSKKDCRY